MLHEIITLEQSTHTGIYVSMHTPGDRGVCTIVSTEQLKAAVNKRTIRSFTVNTAHAMAAVARTFNSCSNCRLECRLYSTCRFA
jgi:hypothetical protein